MNNIDPNNLKKLIAIKEQLSKSLRDERDYFLLDIPKVPNYKMTQKAFSFAAPCIWNLLPYHIRTYFNTTEFKSKLITYYFNVAFV